MLTIYITFVRSQLGYADIIHDKPFNDYFKEKLLKIQHSLALIITGAIKDTSLERLYKALGIHSLSDKRWCHKLVFFYKIVKGHIYNLICFMINREHVILILTHSRLNFSHLHKHKFRHNFSDTINPMCNCSADIETTICYLKALPILFNSTSGAP